jgi:head-tail adaptor
MNYGDLRHLVDIQHPFETVGAGRQKKTSYSNLYTGIFAKVSTLSGREYLLGGIDSGHSVKASLTHKVKIRWHDNLSPECRVVWGSRILNIDFIQEDKTHKRWQILYCVEEV